MRLLITGIRGFVGLHLARLSKDLGWDVFGTSRSPSVPLDLGDGRFAPVAGWAPELDQSPEKALKEFQPDAIVHLAAESFAGSGGVGSPSLWKSNLDGTRILLDSIAHHSPKSKLLFVGTGLSYGPPSNKSAKSVESDPLSPPNAYAATKSCADILCQMAHKDPGLFVIRARPFNHIGPGQSAKFAVSSFTKQFAAMKKGLVPKVLRTGNLSSSRDFTDVRDIARGYIQLLESGQPGEAYNLGSGTATSLETVIEHLKKITGIDPEIIPDPQLFRKSDPPVLLADISKIKSTTGWAPGIPLSKTLKDLWADWSSRPDSDLIPENSFLKKV